MEKKRFIFIGCLLVIAAISLFAMMQVSPQRENRDSDAQTSSAHQATNNGTITGNSGRNMNGTSGTKKDMPVSGNPDKLSNDTLNKINGSGTDNSVSKPTASINSQINSASSKNLSISDANGNLPAGQNARSTVPAEISETTDEAKTDNAKDLYANNPEAQGQDGETLPDAKAVLERKAQDILKYYKDRTAKAEVIETVTDGENGSQQQTSTTSTDTPAATADDTVQSLAEQNLNSENIDHELQVKQILAALAESNPTEVRLQAMFMLADAEPDLVKNFLKDKDDLIRNEAERIVGILPQDY
jgi:hypothetical protein